MRFSLRSKIVLLIIFNAVLLGLAAILINGAIISGVLQRHYEEHAASLAGTVAVSVDGDQAGRLRDAVMEIYRATPEAERIRSDQWGTPAFNAYIDRFSQIEQNEDWLTLLTRLKLLQDQNDGNCIYLTYIDPETEAGVYLVDAAEEDACPPGCFDEIYDFNRESITNPERGFPAYISRTEEYGWLVTAGAPVHDAAGNVVAFACVDISMTEIKATLYSYILFTALILLVLTVIVCLTGFFLVDRFIVRPVHKLSDAAEKYVSSETGNIQHTFSEVDIKTGDEIEELSDSMKKMESDVNEYITNLFAARQEIISTREEAEKLSEIANKDVLTGVRNKRAYDVEVDNLDIELGEGMKDFGIAIFDLNDLKLINDRYGHDNGNFAIQKLCGMICEIFAHSPVFRFGGDEFVVILRNQDLAHIENLAADFESMQRALETASDLEGWERISAAMGYAIYDKQTDACAGDVFRRADGAMYERKKNMKRAGRT